MVKLVVVNGATTKCTGSGQSSFLLVPPGLQIEVDGEYPATIADHVPGDNIIPFGPCKFLGGRQCAPVTLSPWTKGEPRIPFGPHPSLNMGSRLKCDLGGKIKLLSSGQVNPFFSTDCNPSLSAQLMAEFYAVVPVAAGTDEYYRERLADFLRRNPGFTPPDYYLNYGDKYMRKMLALNLSPKGREFALKARRLLQEAIEERRRADPRTFADLELDSEEFTNFAFRTHTRAYEEAGFYDIPLRDKVKIVNTVSNKNKWRGRREAAQIIVGQVKDEAQEVPGEVKKVIKGMGRPIMPLIP